MTFLDHYLNYSKSNEAPKVYHLWSGLSLLSHLIGPRVWTDMGGNLKFYPNMYVNLVGIPGIMKTTAMKQAERLVETLPQIAISPASVSKEALVKLMAEDGSPCRRSYKVKNSDKGEIVAYSQVSIFASEIVSLLNASGNPMGMIEFLTDIWDRPGTQYRELFKNKGNNVIIRPYVTLLACLTPETMKKLVNDKVVSSGMSRRCLFVFADRNGEPVPFITPSAEQMKSLEQCMYHAKCLQDINGPFSWDQDAREFYTNWYSTFKVKVPHTSSATLRLFYMSKAEYVIKVSMLLGLAETPPILVHTEPNFKQALHLVTSIETGAVKLFDGAGRNELASIADEVEMFVQNNSPVRMNVLYAKFWKDLRDGNTMEVDKIIQHLVREGKVTETLQITGGSPSKIVSWLGKKD